MRLAAVTVCGQAKYANQAGLASSVKSTGAAARTESHTNHTLTHSEPPHTPPPPPLPSPLKRSEATESLPHMSFV